ncbi:MAG: putative acyl-CoA dehydrogenase [Rhodobacteraceae bacterium HLUCCA12]|nr:MAG: putative acyl-CoA dehydrogenase [Rhodobacteraceae bacterium HLUCCA12]
MQFSFPPAQLPETACELRDAVQEFLDRERSAGTWTNAECSGWMAFNRAFSLRCGAAGFIGMTWPVQYGGQERSALERYVVMEEMLAAGAPMGAHWISDRQSGPQILKHGNESLKSAIIPAICRGEVAFAIGMSEPDAGSDLAAIRSKAHAVEGGWILNGRKIWTTNGNIADYMIGLFRTEDAEPGKRHHGMTQFVVKLTSEGISRRPIADIPGRDEFAEIVLDDVFVPDDHVLGVPGGGWNLVTAELANERSGPDRFLSVFPLLQEVARVLARNPGRFPPSELGRIVTRLSVLREMSMSIAGQIARGETPALNAAISKDIGNALEREIPEVLRRYGVVMPISGGSEADSLLRDVILSAPSFTLRGGTPEILRGIIAKGLGLSK